MNHNNDFTTSQSTASSVLHVMLKEQGCEELQRQVNSIISVSLNQLMQ
jgi:hypothetical protein